MHKELEKLVLEYLEKKCSNIKILTYQLEKNDNYLSGTFRATTLQTHRTFEAKFFARRISRDTAQVWIREIQFVMDI